MTINVNLLKRNKLKDDTAQSEDTDNVCMRVCSLPIHTKICEQQC